MQKIKLSLTNYTAIAFSSFLFITISILIIVSYNRMSEMAHDATAQQFQRYVDDIYTSVNDKYKPITQLFGYLTTSSDWDYEKASDISLIKAIDLTRYLAKDTLTNSIYMGFSNGDLLGAHKLSSKTKQYYYDAPENATFVIETLEYKQAGSNTLTRVYLSPDFKIIDTTVTNNDSLNVFERTWYKIGIQSLNLVPTPVYKDLRTNEDSLTLVQKHQFADVVIATDLNIKTIVDSLKSSDLSHDAIRILFGDQGQFIIYHNNDSRFSNINNTSDTDTDTDTDTDMASLLQKDQFKQIVRNNLNKNKLFTFDFKGEKWLAQSHKIGFFQGNKAHLIIAVPKNSILAPSKKMLKETMLMLVSIGFLFIPLSWFFARVLTRPLRTLSEQIKQVTALDVSETTTTLSHIDEIADLQLSTAKMRKTLDDFLRLLTMLSNEQDIHSLLEKTCSKASVMLEADCAFVYLKSAEDDSILEPFILHTQNDSINADISQCPNLSTQWPYEKLRNNVNVKDIQFNLIHPMLKTALVKAGIHPENSNVYTLTIPLVDRSGHILGLLGFSYDECLGGDDLTHVMGVAKALSDFVSLSFEGQDLIAKQKELLNSFIKLIAGAIDTKSPYTGAHCQRVPELASMLAAAACKSTHTQFRKFNLDSEGWEQLNIAAWLHDCGKVTTPEYVIDKATKLETIYNRINEIRMRFEVLIRDAQIQALTAISQGECAKQTNNILADNIRLIEDDFAFLAKCNLGENVVDDDAIARIESISQQTWLRFLDDELGLSPAELAQKNRTAPITLPIMEPVLSDRAEHMISHIDNSLELEAHLRFNMKRPLQRNNQGELHNLMIQRGTINAEERYIINHHVIQTITMLEQLPLPPHLSRVPEIAGGHHEQLNGRGYPRGYQEEEISLEARILAIADVFEALTASDRPYKTAKSLSQSIKILSFMSKDRHIDSDLFKLFLSSGIYLEYAHKYLKPEQIDNVDISAYL
ncbi:HD domain-containing phosphohydrolase [Moritella sp. Urea-trap-13]|uniref:HD domain-containing phosphohydrolase n=1 Tax=Moritella sp. Urea-trap-13 TaxID=2058327 RepID=UPI000C326326|nr:HD domain-containing phosphohydrolase [Moritella sp. Urea-trap-13]PKH06759.1 chemotaxis protein [Moritella sp. Urea-trap-13]